MQRLGINKEINVWDILGTYGVFITFLVLFVGNSIFTNNFLSMTTVQNILGQCTTSVLLGIGMTVVISTGGINISVGSVMAMCAMVTAKIIKDGNLVTGMAAGMVLALLCGALTGYIIIKFDIQPMIVSLAMMFILRGVAKLLNDGKNMRPGNPALNSFFYETVFGIPVRTVIWLVCAVLVFILISKTRFGICIESFGDNSRAARIAGINIVAVIVSCYVICNALSYIAGFIEMGYSSIVDPGNMGLTKEMDAIAATVLGGTSIDGGKPRIWGTVCGAMVLQMISIMVNMNNVPSSYAKIIKAAIIILAIYFQGMKKNN